MKQILVELRRLNSHLSFLKKCFTKNGFRHVIQYIDGIIALSKKTVKQISKAAGEKGHSLLNRILTEAKFKQDELEARYIKKIKYFTRGKDVSLLFDDTLVEREGKLVEETMRHKDHSNDDYIIGHQFFTSIIYTPILQMPLFPKLYSKNTESKIQMAADLINLGIEKIGINTVIFDSWYSDKKLINKCRTKGIKVVCAIKTNRKISLKRGEWQSLATFSKNVEEKELENYFIDEIKYKIADYEVKLNGIPKVKMLVSHEWSDKHEKWNAPFHLISTNPNDTPVQIIRKYCTRWFIETYHRDMKQNLGFAKLFVRKKEGIVRHAIFCSLAYAALKMFMFLRGMKNTIGDCIAYIQNREMDDFVQEIIEIEDKKKRLMTFEEVFIRRIEKV